MTPEMPTQIVSKTVYSLYYPETAKLIEAALNPFPHHLYTEAWTKKQDELHGPFFEAWQNVLGTPALPGVRWGIDFPHQYPCNGSSEAIRETLADLAVESQQRRKLPRVHVFSGEYEGYRAIAEGYGFEVVEHSRNQRHESDWRLAATNINKQMRPGDRFYISHPSSIDDNIWPHIDEFITLMAEHNPGVGIYLDLCYVGTTQKPVVVTNANLFNVQALFFSLSKVYGVYYHRMGGVYSRKRLPGLVGNMWFKNLLSLHLGKMLLNHFGGSLPKTYGHLQKRAVEALEGWYEKRGDVAIIKPSDVVLLAHSEGRGFYEWDQELQRAGGVRYCLTPFMGLELGQ